MVAKTIDELEIAHMSFYASYTLIIELDTKKSRGGKSGLGMVAETERKKSL